MVRTPYVSTRKLTVQLLLLKRKVKRARCNTGTSYSLLSYAELIGVFRGVILLKVIEYLAYKVQYTDYSTEDITEDFSDRIDPYIALEL